MELEGLWRNRIIETRMIDAGELMSHPLNPRRHPEKQREAVQGLLTEIGIVDTLKVYWSEKYGGKWVVIDGNLRKEIGGLWPCAILDLSDEEAELMLTTYDYTVGMATLDSEAMAHLLEVVSLQPIENSAVLDLLATIDATYDEMGEVVEPEEEAGGSGKGTLLERVEITVADPTHLVERGEVWDVGRHVLICVPVLTGWPTWVRYLTGDDCLFAPYAGPFVPLTLKAADMRLVMVQPDPYIAGHILDRFVEQHGEGAIGRSN